MDNPNISVTKVPNASRKLRVSYRAYRETRTEAIKQGLTSFAYLRRKARTLVSAVDPKFTINGHDLLRTVEIGLSDHVWASLKALATDLGVPEEAVGELLCSFVMPRSVAV
jgi:hypothetical protein